MEFDNSKEFIEYTKEYEHLLVMFYATWCPPCKMLKPIILEFMDNHEEANVLFVNTDTYKNIAPMYDIHNVPVLLFFKNGSIVDSQDAFIDYEDLEERYADIM